MKKIMKKFFFIFLIILVLFGSAYLLLKDRVGDIRPTLLPPSKNLPEELMESKTGSSPDIPIVLPEGFEIGVFETGLAKVRDLEFSPRGTLLASLFDIGEVIALPDKNNDGVADSVYKVAENLDHPHGIAFYNGNLFIAEEKMVSRYSYDEVNFKATLEKKLFDLPVGGRHTTRSIVFDKKGNMYVSIGSTCDTCIEKDSFISTVIISDSEGKSPRVFSKGLRNAVFLTVNPSNDQVWATEMGRDFLGNEIPSDEINILQDGADFGWPYCYDDMVWDRSFGRKDQVFCDSTISPYFKIPAHSAPLGITFINSRQMPDAWQGDLLVAYHGSWNRTPPTGYKIVRISTKGVPQATDFITGFLQGSDALGRPVDVIFNQEGSLFISDDKANAIYKVIKK